MFTSAAWHFSSFGSSKSFRLKLKTHPHEEYNNDYFVDDKTLIGRAHHLFFLHEISEDAEGERRMSEAMAPRRTAV